MFSRKVGQAQSTLEYIIVLAAIMGAILFGAAKMKNTIDGTVTSAKTALGNAAGQFNNTTK